MPTDETLTSAGLTDDEVELLLTTGSLTVVGRLASASNASFLAQVELDGLALPCIYKPVAGERPLWDFPDGTLAGRELAARFVSEAGGWGLVPPTVVRDGRFGRGMCQRWIDVDAEQELVGVVESAFDEPGWIAVLEAEDSAGRAVLLVHADDSRLRDMAVFDAVINNADRKGGHLLPESSTSATEVAADPATGSGDRVWGCDHGVTFHSDPKLRTILWGWAGQSLRPADVEALGRLTMAFDSGLERQLSEVLSASERLALRRRIASLLKVAEMPAPEGSWPAVPWPPF